VYLYFIIACNVLQYNSVNGIVVSCCHLANTSENEYDHRYLYSLGGRQLCQNFELNGLVTLTIDLLISNWGHESPVPWASLLPVFSSLRYSILDLWSGTGPTDRQTDNVHHCIMPHPVEA